MRWIVPRHAFSKDCKVFEVSFVVVNRFVYVVSECRVLTVPKISLGRYQFLSQNITGLRVKFGFMCSQPTTKLCEVF